MILRPVRTTQPQGPARIDRSNPLARRAQIALALAGNFVNAANGRPVTNNGNVGFLYAPNGIVANIINPAYLSVPSAAFKPPTDQFTYAISVTTTSHDGVQTLFSAWDNPSSGRNIYAGINTNNVQFDIPYKQALCFSAAPPVGLHHYIFTVYNGVGSVYVDGKHFASTAISTTIETPNNPLFIGRNSTNADNLNGTINNVFVSPEGFSAKMAAELYANQWQIFAPDSKSLWVPETVSAGGGATTGTLAATESGSDTAVISGQVVVQGAIAATEAGQDTAALAGQVIITGTLAAAEIGSDTAAINGSASVTTTGTLAATESGSDTAALTGRVLVQGALSATESGSDAAAIAGQVFVQGTLAATEQGSDTALINGSSVITTTGTLNATEQGSDTVAMTGQVLVQALIDAAEQGADTAQLVGQIVVTGVLAAAEVGGDTAAFLQSEAVFLPSIHNAYVPLPRNQAYAPLAANQAYVPTPTNQAYLP